MEDDKTKRESEYAAPSTVIEMTNDPSRNRAESTISESPAHGSPRIDGDTGIQKNETNRDVDKQLGDNGTVNGLNGENNRRNNVQNNGLEDGPNRDVESKALKSLQNRLDGQLGPRPLPAGTVNENVLAEIISAYVKRSTCEDLDILADSGGQAQILHDLHVLGTEGLDGKDEEDITRRRHQFGKNEMPKKKLTPYWTLVWEASKDPMLRVLILAGIASLSLGLAFGEHKSIEWIEGAAILAAVIIVIGVTATNDYLTEKQFANLYAQEEKTCSVMRNGQVEKLGMKQLVMGDIVALETGDEIPADCLVIKQTQFKVDESSLTGESDAIAKMTITQCLEERETKKEKLKLAESGKGHHIVSSPCLLSGTAVTQGSATAVVVAVGLRSQVGKLFSKLTVDTEPTPLQNKLNALARDVGKFGFFAATTTLITLMALYWISYAVDDQHRQNRQEIARSMVEYVVTSITIIVVAVPEGLPLAVTISLAFSVGRMLQDQNFVRRLAACETMGGANEVCSDKTGTLTKNIMQVEAFWNGSVVSNDIVAEPIPQLTAKQRLILVHNIAVNSTGYLEKSLIEIGDQTKRMKQVVKQVGSPTECALLEFLDRIAEGTQEAYDYEAIRKMFSGRLDSNPEPYENKAGVDLIVHKIPFSSDRKAMTTVVVHPTDSSLLRCFIKGASEVVLRRCSMRINTDGSEKSLTKDKIEKIEKTVIHQFASQALRTICLAYKDFKPSDYPNWETEMETEDTGGNPLFQKIEKDFICLGITGIRDPVREEVPGAVALCQKAGIRVRMCTGDNIETARQIAIKARIYHPEDGGIAMLGPDFYKLVGGVICANCGTEHCPCENTNQAADDPDGDEDGEKGGAGCCGSSSKKKEGDASKSNTKRVDVLGSPEKFDEIADKLEVLARSQPNDKYALVTGLKNRGAIVAVTGDGTNDAPALKKADVGFAMGITGKEVAKQAADIVLLDDNFESIVRACKWGRNIYDNIRRFLQFQLTVNVVAVLTAFIGAVVLRGSPLSAVQLLWVNLIMDTFAALALATEMPTDKLLSRPPHKRDDYLVDRLMVRNIVTQAVYQTAVMMAVVFSGECWLPEYAYKLPEAGMQKFPDFSPFSKKCGNGNTVISGRRYHFFQDEEDYKLDWRSEFGPSRHYTYVFNIFVFMQAFNLLNARKIGAHEYNIFSGVYKNFWWISIICIIIFGQVVMVQFGRYALNCHVEGLTVQQWFICVAFGFGTWVVSFLTKLIPNKIINLLPQTGQREVNPIDEPPSLALASRGRISSGRISARMNIGPHQDPARARSSIAAALVKAQSNQR